MPIHAPDGSVLVQWGEPIRLRQTRQYIPSKPSQEVFMRFALPFFLLGALMTSDISAQMPPPPMMTTGTLLTISAEAELKAAPDIASISAGVVTTAATAQEAMAQNATRMTAMIAALKKSGVADKDMQTSGLSLQPQYAYNNNDAPKLTGYQANNNVNVVVRKLDTLGTVLDTLASKGASNLNGPNFGVDQPDPIMDEARTKAVDKAMKRAELYARATGMKIKRIVSITEGGGMQQAPMPYAQNMSMAVKTSADTPIATGRVGIASSVTMTFELEK
jgi:uncharacterized protein